MLSPPPDLTLHLHSFPQLDYTSLRSFLLTRCTLCTNMAHSVKSASGWFRGQSCRLGIWERHSLPNIQQSLGFQPQHCQTTKLKAHNPVTRVASRNTFTKGQHAERWSTLLDRVVHIHVSPHKNNPAPHGGTGHLLMSTTAELLDRAVCRRQEFLRSKKRKTI